MVRLSRAKIFLHVIQRKSLAAANLFTTFLDRLNEFNFLADIIERDVIRQPLQSFNDQCFVAHYVKLLSDWNERQMLFKPTGKL